MFAPMAPAVTRAVKGAALGAGIGLFFWIGKQVLPTHAAVSPFDQLTDEANLALSYDADVRTLCERMKQYQRLDEESFAKLLVNWAQLINLSVQLQRQELKPNMALPRVAAQFVSQIVESVRRIRAILGLKFKQNTTIMADFDEIAASIQRRCNEYQHNITKSIEYAQYK
jgi:hypothetical protein